ncbi:MAG: hypothetical protein AB1333_03235 [Patescibacteria group bacterium]
MEEKNTIFNKIKEASTPIMALATIILAVMTYLQVLETKELKAIDIGPNISLSDIELELIDKNGTPIKRTSWKDGEKLQTNAVNIMPGEAILVMRFKNTGKDAGYIKNIYIKDQASTTMFTPKNDVPNLPTLVPANGETGLLYGTDVSKINAEEKGNELQVNLKYGFEVYNSKLELKNEFDINIRCSQIQLGERGIQHYCFPFRSLN